MDSSTNSYMYACMDSHLNSYLCSGFRLDSHMDSYLDSYMYSYMYSYMNTHVFTHGLVMDSHIDSYMDSCMDSYIVPYMDSCRGVHMNCCRWEPVACRSHTCLNMISEKAVRVVCWDNFFLQGSQHEFTPI